MLVRMVLNLKLIGTFIACLPCTLAEPVLKARAATSLSAGECTNTHFPTEETYLQGLAQYCDKHVEDSLTLQDKEELVVTMELRDKLGYPIKWIYKIRFEDHSSVGEGPFRVNHGTCLEKFKLLTENPKQGELGIAYCMDGETKVIVGGKYVAGGSSLIKNLGRPGSQLWIETKQKSDDYWTPRPF